MSWVGITGSAAGDTAACPARAAFPQVRSTGAYAERGNALHKFAEMVALHPEKRDEFLKDVPEEWRQTAEGMKLEALTEGLEGQRRMCEVAYVVNVESRTARFLGVNIGREYEAHVAKTSDAPLGKYDIPLTIDLEDTVEGGVPIEQDYKSGRYCGEPFEQFQRKLSAAALMFFYEASEAQSRVCYIRDDGTVKFDGCTFSIIDAWDACDTMVKAIDRVVAAREQWKSGVLPTVYPDAEKQCKYCAAFSLCPAWNNMLRGGAEHLAKTSVEDLTATTPEEAGKWMAYVKDLLKVATSFEETLKERAKREPLPIDDKNEYGVKEKEGRSYFDGAAARGQLVIWMSKAGATDDEVQAALGALQKQGRKVEEVRKRKRSLT